MVPIFDQMLKPLMPLRKGKGRIFAAWKDKWAFGAYFQRLIQRATSRKNAGLLIARHSVHTWLVHARVNMAKVAQWMGNSPRVIERSYLGRAPDAAEPITFTYLGHPLEAGGPPPHPAARRSKVGSSNIVRGCSVRSSWTCGMDILVCTPEKPGGCMAGIIQG